MAHRDDPDCPLNPLAGSIIQLNTLNQFSRRVGSSIAEFEAPSATCGYFACANALLLADALRAHGVVSSNHQVEELRLMLQEPDVVMTEVRAAMAFIQQSRRAWIAQQQKSFTSRSSQQYMKAWVANYEVSDYMIQSGDRAAGVFFMRYNQWPERNTAEHEELARLQLEESQFGGNQTGDKTEVALEQGAARFIIEEFRPVRQLTRTADWGPHAENSVFVIDLNGHFVAALSAIVDQKRTLILFNTTSANYINGAAAATFDLVHNERFL